MKTTASNLISWSGMVVMVAGIYFASIQPIHPADVVASVTTGTWAIITSLKWVMCILFLVGIAGIYARQVKETGWLAKTDLEFDVKISGFIVTAPDLVRL